MSIPALAQDSSDAYDGLDEAAIARSDRIVFGVTRYNFLKSDDSQFREGASIEYRMASLPLWRVHPWFGFDALERKALWAGAGLETDISLAERLYLTLQLGAGYFDDGDQPAPPNPLIETGFNFRSRLELGYDITPAGPRVAVGVSHVSNANLTGKDNPGINAVYTNLQVPMDVFTGR